MDLEESIKGVLQEKLSDGTLEKIISEQFEKGMTTAISNLMGHFGSVNKAIEKKVEEIMIPAIGRHDFSTHLVKLDSLLTDIINNTALVDNKKLLENFKELMIEDESRRVIKVSELFGMWCNFVSKEVDTCGLEVVFDDEPSYEDIEVTMTVEHTEGRSWSDFKKANIVFECEHDEKMNVLIPISNWAEFDGDNWDMDYKKSPDINSLRHMSDFEVLLLKLERGCCKIILDVEDAEECVSPEAEPEVDYS